MSTCPSCFKGVAFTETPKGHIDAELDGAYVAPNDVPATRAVIVLTDIFGIDMPNPKVLADRYAEQLGCDVYVPDFFAGKPPVKPEAVKSPERVGERMGWWERLMFLLFLLPYIPAMIAQRPAVTDERLRQFLAKLQAKKGYEKLGAIGFCYGGSMAIRFGATNAFSTLAICHPGKHSKEDFAAIKVPCSWNCAQEDFYFSDQMRLEAEAEFVGRKGKANEVPHEFKIYNGTTHGFAVRPNLSIPEVKEAFEACRAQVVQWFEETLIHT